jgi:chromate transporter
MVRSSLWDLFKVSLKLGLTSFGGPIAHIGYFREEYVNRKKWLDEKSYADLVALCQFLPGPASSQVGIGIGLMRGGLPGAITAWLGFTLPSALALASFAYLYQGYGTSGSGWIHGLQLAAVVIVAQAVWGMGRSLTPDRTRMSIAVITAIVTLLWGSPWSQVLLIAAGGLAGLALYKEAPVESVTELPKTISKKPAAAALILFFGLLILLPLLRNIYPTDWMALIDSFYRSGALVFGGGHVVLPLLEQEVVSSGWMTEQQFLAGYGAAQAVPGPLFTFAAYLGMALKGWVGAAAALFAIFLPAFLLVVGVLPFWHSLRQRASAKRALFGINAVVVGMLLAALYNPVWTSAVHTPVDFGIVLAAFVLLMYWKLPPWLIVAFAALAGWLISWI